MDRRQAVLAQNIANANTPGYTAKDVASFDQVLARTVPALAETSPLHLAGTTSGFSANVRPHERAPDGNAVSVEEQLTKVADTAGVQALTLNLYRKYAGMFRLAIGK